MHKTCPHIFCSCWSSKKKGHFFCVSDSSGVSHPSNLHQGPPSNEDAKEKAAQGIKSFEQLISTKCK